MKSRFEKITALAGVGYFWTTEAYAGWLFGTGGQGTGAGGNGNGNISGGHAPEIDGPAGLTAIALVACVGLYLYNRYRHNS